MDTCLKMDTKPLTRHQRHRQQTRQKLLSALLELSLEKGYDNVSIQDITDRADLARATFYIHARDKEDLMWTWIQEVIHVTEQEVEQRYHGVPPPQAEYYGYLNIFGHIDRNRDTYRLVLGSKGSAQMADRVHQYLVGETVRDIRQVGIYTDFTQPPEVAAQIIVGAILSLAIWWLETPNPYIVEQMAAMLYEALHQRKPPVV